LRRNILPEHRRMSFFLRAAGVSNGSWGQINILA